MVPVLWIVSPCYKDSDTILQSVPIMVQKLQILHRNGLIDEKSRLLLVDDGSPDDTWQSIEKLCAEYENVCSIHNQRNVGEETAYLTGLSVAVNYADVIITIDCDLQDDIHLCEKMLREFSSGYDIVYGFRNDRSTDSFLYRGFANGYYKLMQLLGSNIVPQASQFRLMSKTAVKELLQMPASFPFLPAMVPQLNFNSTKLPYKRNERVAGTSGYSYYRLFRLAFKVITEYTDCFTLTEKLARGTVFISSAGLAVNDIYRTVRKKHSDTPYYFLLGVCLASFGVMKTSRYFLNKKNEVKTNYILATVDREIMK